MYSSGTYKGPLIRERLASDVCRVCERLILHQVEALEKSEHSTYYLTEIDQDPRFAFDRAKCKLCLYVRRIACSRGPIPHQGQDHSVDFEKTRHRHSTSMGPIEGSNKGSFLASVEFGGRRSDKIFFATCLSSSTPDMPIWQTNATPDPIQRLPIVKKWLNVCQTNHEHCRMWSQNYNRSAPTRVLNVQPPKIRLEEPSTCVRYCALSHCWGSEQPLRTLRANLDDHKRDIRMESLPKTFQDAIMVAREVGVSYIWIDSLCIIQDDSSDWEKEAARMASIYEGAEFTIAAVWGADGRAGCFHEYLPPLAIDVYKRDPQMPAMHVLNGRLNIRPQPDDRKYLTTAQLNTRKWVLQERLLSLRTISFTEEQIRWSCATAVDSEDELVFEPVSSHMMNTVLYYKSEDDPDRCSQFHLRESWAVALQSYSRRNLTYASDKLAAIAGVCASYERIFGDRHRLGLWESDLARTLLWSSPAGSSHPELDHEAIQALNIPSWCWARLKGEILAATEYGAGPLIEILNDNTDIKWTGLPMTSAIAEAIIIARGKLLHITQAEAKPNETCMCYLSRFHLSIGNAKTVVVVEIYIAHLDQCVDKLPADLCFLPVYDNEVQTRWTIPNNPEMEITGLLLTRKPGSTNAFTRLGVVNFDKFPRSLLDATPEQDFELH